MSYLDTKVSLKPYLKTITDDCSDLTKQELTGIILGLAKDEPSSRRVAFLQKFQALLPGSASKAVPETDIGSILNELNELKESINERIEAVESGNYEALDDWDWEDHYYDDEPDVINDEQAADLACMFQNAEDLMLSERIDDAKSLYRALFDLLAETGDYGVGSSEFDVDLSEERARYARCVYDATDRAKRLDEFAEAMMLHASYRFHKNRIDKSLPMLQDVIDAREEEMADLQWFYSAWRKLLTKMGTEIRPASLLIEAIYHLEGFEGVAKPARRWKNDQPYGYLFWLERLKEENRLDDIVEVSKEAMDALNHGGDRECVCDFLIEASTLLENKGYILEGKREKFFSYPCDANLLQLQKEAVKQDKRDKTLKAVLAFLSRQKETEGGDKSMYLKSLLMAGRLDDAFGMGKESESIGWSRGLNVGLVFGAVAIVVADYDENAQTARDLLAGYAGRSSAYSYRIDILEEDDITFHAEIIKGAKKIKHPKTDLKKYFSWALKTGRNRVDHIVSNTHRGAYERAAQVLGTLAEMYAATGDDKAAAGIIREYCKEKYNRHSAFKREVRAVISRSGLLKSIGISV